MFSALKCGRNVAVNISSAEYTQLQLSVNFSELELGRPIADQMRCFKTHTNQWLSSIIQVKSHERQQNWRCSPLVSIKFKRLDQQFCALLCHHLPFISFCSNKCIAINAVAVQSFLLYKCSYQFSYFVRVGFGNTQADTVATIDKSIFMFYLYLSTLHELLFIVRPSQCSLEAAF